MNGGIYRTLNVQRRDGSVGCAGDEPVDIVIRQDIADVRCDGSLRWHHDLWVDVTAAEGNETYRHRDVGMLGRYSPSHFTVTPSNPTRSTA